MRPYVQSLSHIEDAEVINRSPVITHPFVLRTGIRPVDWSDEWNDSNESNRTNYRPHEEPFIFPSNHRWHESLVPPTEGATRTAKPSNTRSKKKEHFQSQRTLPRPPQTRVVQYLCVTILLWASLYWDRALDYTLTKRRKRTKIDWKWSAVKDRSDDKWKTRGQGHDRITSLLFSNDSSHRSPSPMDGTSMVTFPVKTYP